MIAKSYETSYEKPEETTEDVCPLRDMTRKSSSITVSIIAPIPVLLYSAATGHMCLLSTWDVDSPK